MRNIGRKTKPNCSVSREIKVDKSFAFFSLYLMFGASEQYRGFILANEELNNGGEFALQSL